MQEQKRQKIPGLWVVGTPIGNLSDVSFRLLDTLQTVDVIYCEDTRRTRELLTALAHRYPEKFTGPFPRLVRLDAHAESAVLDRAIEMLQTGTSAAVVSDAGMPAVSDPGAMLVRRALQKAVRVSVIPGPSALTAFVSAAGFVNCAFVFRGFFPRKDAEHELQECQQSTIARTFVWFESPERIDSTLKVLAQWAPASRLVAAKELTKAHERVFEGSAENVARQVSQHSDTEGRRGEWVVGIEFEEHKTPEVSEEFKQSALLALECLLESGISPSEAAKQVSHKFGIKKRLIYERATELAKKI